MKRLILVILAAGAATLAGCDEPRSDQTETAPPPVENPAPPPVETPPVPETTPPPQTGSSTLPPDQRSSEETVKPESETLFY